MRKRAAAFMLVSVMAMFFLTGCANKNGNGYGEKEPDRQSQEETGNENGSDIVELSFYVFNDPVADQERIMDKANEIIEKEIGAHLNLVIVDSAQYKDKMNLMINTGEKWDLCFTASWIDFYNQAAKGVYADLTDLLPELAPQT